MEDEYWDKSTDNKNENILDRINAWSLSENPFARFVRMVAKSAYAVGTVAAGLVVGITNTILGREIVRKEQEHDERIRAGQRLDGIVKEVQKEQNKEENAKPPELMNRNTFFTAAASQHAIALYQNAGLYAVCDEKNGRIELYSNQDRDYRIGIFRENDFLNGNPVALAGALMECMARKDGYSEIPQDKLEDYQNKANIYALVMQGSMFLDANGKQMKELYSAFEKETGSSIEYLKREFILASVQFQEYGKKYNVQAVFEPECLQGMSLYRNGIKFATFTMEELCQGGLHRAVEQAVSKVKDINKDILHRPLQFGDVILRQEKEGVLSAVNEKSGVKVQCEIKDAESISQAVHEMRNAGIWNGTGLEYMDAALVTSSVHVLEIPYKTSMKEMEVSKDGENITNQLLLNTVREQYVPMQEISYFVRKEKDKLNLYCYQEEPKLQKALALNVKSIRQSDYLMYRYGKELAEKINNKTGLQYTEEQVSEACKKAARQSMKSPGTVVVSDDIANINVVYNEKTQKMIVSIQEGVCMTEQLVAGIMYEQADGDSVLAFAQEVLYLDNGQNYSHAVNFVTERRDDVNISLEKETTISEMKKEYSVHMVSEVAGTTEVSDTAMEVVSERLDKSKDFAGNLLQDAVLDGTEETVDYVTDFQAETEFECETEYRESMER